MDTLKENINTLKTEIENFKCDVLIVDNTKELEILREARNKILDERINDIKQDTSNNVTLNIGGKIFKTNKRTLTSTKDNLFCSLLEKVTDYSKEIFLDRSYKQFPIILRYLRTHDKNIFENGDLNRFDLIDLKRELIYYNLFDILPLIEELMQNIIEFVSFEWNCGYKNYGTNRLEDLESRDLNSGFAIMSPGWIVIQLSNEHLITRCEIGGYGGNTTNFSPSYGCNAQILTSIDKNNWTEVGRLPSNYSDRFTMINLTPSRCIYIKISHSSYLGIGFLKLYSN